MYFFKTDRSTPALVRKVLTDKGWQEVQEEQTHFHIHWKCQRFLKSEVYSCVANQRLNHFPKTSEISRKVTLLDVESIGSRSLLTWPVG